MTKKIIVKEVDRFYSSKKDKNYVSEYLVYVNVSGTNIACTKVIGNDEKSIVIHEYIVKFFDPIPKMSEMNDLIEEITIYKN